jgi:NitT/TauT family transport system substrate-binding protein
MRRVHADNFRLFSLTVLVIFALAGLSRSEAAEDQVLHVGIAPFEAQAGVYYAIDAGFFKKVGLNVDVQQLQSGPAIAAAIVGGSLQIGISNPLSIAIARENRFPFVYIAPGYMWDTHINPTYTALVVAAPSTIKDGKGFEGKAIAGTGSKGLDYLAGRAWIDQHGGDSSNVSFVELPQGSMEDAVASGRIAAAILAEPALSAALAAGRVKILAKPYDAVSKRFMVVGWFTTANWATKNAGDVRKFEVAINEASAWAVQHPEAAADILRKYMKTTFTRAHEYHVRSLDPGLIQPVLDAALEYRLLTAHENANGMIFSP